LIGSHIAETLVARGERVLALVRPNSDVTFLKKLGVALATVALNQTDELRRAVSGAKVVYHCAARVSDWGPWRLFQEEVVDATLNLLDACRGTVGRVLYLSSITVYGRPRCPGQITEDEPLGQRLRMWDYYCRAKILAEQLARAHAGECTIVRPGWSYGPRDRNTLPRLIKALQAGRVSLIGDGSNLLNLVYASDVAEGAILAANHPSAAGQAYNLCSEGELTQRGFLDAVTQALGRPPVRRHVPFWLAYFGGFSSEVIGRIIRIKRPPHITRYAVALVGRPTRFSIAKARSELGWQPRINAEEGIRRTLEWLRGEEARTRLPAPRLEASA
jgi:nucleoside-diphosphate-sugar epimerase